MKRTKLLKGARKGVATPHLRRRGRGKPFEKNNSFGIATRFKPGQSGNPGGRPRFAKLSEAFRALLEVDPTQRIVPCSNAEAIALKLIKQARKGNISAAREAGDRSEGKPATTLSVLDERNDPLTQLLEAMTLANGGQLPQSDYRPLLPAKPEEPNDE